MLISFFAPKCSVYDAQKAEHAALPFFTEVNLFSGCGGIAGIVGIGDPWGNEIH
jgi:hypothetical protein